MPVFDFECEGCGWVYEDVYRNSSEVSADVFCRNMQQKIAHLDDDGSMFFELEDGCGYSKPLVKLIGAPAPPVVRAGRWAGEQSQREQAVKRKSRLLKRSYDHEFKKGGKGVEERRARIEQLKKQGVPVVGKYGF